jgi:tetratricopeptide (TPR) repeat protein
VSHALDRSQARLLLAVDSGDWTRVQLRYAAGILLSICGGSARWARPRSAILNIATRAYELAEQAEADPERSVALSQMALAETGEAREDHAHAAVPLSEAGRGLPWSHSQALILLGDAECDRGAIAAARGLYAEALRVGQSPDVWSTAHVSLQELERQLGDCSAACKHAERALQYAPTAQHTARAHRAVAMVLTVQGELAQARDELTNALLLCTEYELLALEQLIRRDLGRLAAMDGRIDAARADLDRAEELLGSEPGMQESYDGSNLDRGLLELRYGDERTGRILLVSVDVPAMPPFAQRHVRLRIADAEHALGNPHAVRRQLELTAALADDVADSEAAAAILRSARRDAAKCGEDNIERMLARRLDTL